MSEPTEYPHEFGDQNASNKKCLHCDRWFHNEGDMDVMFDECPTRAGDAQ